MALNFFKAGYEKVKNALSKTGSVLGHKIRELFTGKGLDDETLAKLEQIFYEADMGVKTTQDLLDKTREIFKCKPNITPNELIVEIKNEIIAILCAHPAELVEVNATETPLVILVVGVNGNGKTTSIAKLTYLYKNAGKKVLLAAADTFRAAAIEQLTAWSEKLEVDIVKGHPKSDPASVAFDAVSAGKSRHADVVIIDTAGRLHTKTPLMQELDKIKRACKKVQSAAPHETILVLDATTGQNAIDQAKIFNQYTPITGLILSKLDSRAKGGIVINIQRELKIPVKFIGIGEGMEDLQAFNPKEFVDALFGHDS